MMSRTRIILLATTLVVLPVCATANPLSPIYSVAPVSVTENAGTAKLVIKKSAKSKTYSQLHIQTVDGTAHAGIDYTAVNKTVLVGYNILNYTVAVPIIDNSTYQGNRVFNVLVSPVYNATIQTGSTKVPVTIVDNEVAPPPPPTQTCPDGTIILATAICPTPPSNSWISAPLQDGNFARVKANDNLWGITESGLNRPLIPGEIVAVYFNGAGYEVDGSLSFAVFTLSDQISGRALAIDLEGVAPIGTPPTLPLNWWIPGLVIANKTCTDPRQGHVGQPGVTQGGIYRAGILTGSHVQLAAGQTDIATTMWQVFNADDLNTPTLITSTVVTGDCITGK